MNDNHSILNVFKSLLKEFLIILLYFVLGLSLTLLVINNHNNILYTLSNILCDLILLIIFLYIFRKVIISKLADFKKNKKMYLKSSFKYYFFGLLIMLISLNIINYFYNNSLNEEANQVLLKAYPIYYILNALIFAPIIEELMTRIYLKDAFKNKYIYIISSGFIFGFLHILNALILGNYYELLYLIPYGSMGLFLSLMYYKTDNIWTSITYHSFHNFICLILSFI